EGGAGHGVGQRNLLTRSLGFSGQDLVAGRDRPISKGSSEAGGATSAAGVRGPGGTWAGALIVLGRGARLEGVRGTPKPPWLVLGRGARLSRSSVAARSVP